MVTGSSRTMQNIKIQKPIYPQPLSHLVSTPIIPLLRP